MDLTTLIIIFTGVFLLTLALIFFVFQLVGQLLLGKSVKPIDEEQKGHCKEAIRNGSAESIWCRFYVKKGLCPNGDCSKLKAKEAHK